MDQETRDTHNLCMGIGYICLYWAFIEQSTDSICSIMFHKAGGKSIKKRLPKFTKHKNRFIVDCVSKLAVLGNYKKQSLNVTGRIALLMDKRHDFIHSSPTQRTAINGFYHFVRLEASDLIHISKEWTFEATKFPAFAKELEGLAKDSQRLAIGLLDQFGPTNSGSIR